ncbi:MAG TPA: 50S ribosomal protein L35 [Candidatus Paceibacterota bacterium]|nr:50S ribosomal protein L35 [Candidatus Paceibacterota bacterium]
MKTNKSITKRFKITKNGKMLTRKGGGNHFNAKESREKQLSRKTQRPITLKNKVRGRFLPGLRVKSKASTKETN